ncbi:MAG: VIT1/CCC1 transporter family protein [Candidatus Dormibacteria bacterium]
MTAVSPGAGGRSGRRALDEALANWRDELVACQTYDRFARTTRDQRRRASYSKLRDIERRHVDLWAGRVREMGGSVPDESRSPRVAALSMLAMVAGDRVAMSAVEHFVEQRLLTRYFDQLEHQPDPATADLLRQVIADEQAHEAGPHGEEALRAGVAGHVPLPFERVDPEAWHGAGASASLRQAIYGVNDGLTATVGIVAGVAAAGSSNQVVLLAGFAGMVASGVSMAGGAYLSSKSQRQVYESQIARERRELVELPDDEKEEMATLYELRGFGHEEAHEIAERIARDPEIFARTHIQDELGVDAEALEDPLREAVVAGVATLFGGFVPLVAFILPWWHGRTALVVALAMSALGLFLMGAARSLVTARPWTRSGAEMLAVGSAAAAAAWVVGRVFNVMTG